MQVAFRKFEEKGRRHCGWTAVRGKRTQIPGSFMGVGADLPHDLAQYVIEAATGFDNGFWGLLAKGATFKSTGRKRTRPGRALISAHRDSLIASEQLAGEHLAGWKTRSDSSVTHALDAAFRQWQALGSSDALVFTWPSPTGVVVAAHADR